ncbi:MAG: DUF1475 family protein [Roseimicrobium sp.]
MIWVLRIFFLAVLVSMIWVTGWASMSVALWKTPREVATHPWFIATLFDAYFGFLTFYCWVCWKETSWTKRVVWLVAILLLGNIAMAVYALNKLFRLPADAGVRELLVYRG